MFGFAVAGSFLFKVYLYQLPYKYAGAHGRVGRRGPVFRSPTVTVWRAAYQSSGFCFYFVPGVVRSLAHALVGGPSFLLGYQGIAFEVASPFYVHFVFFVAKFPACPLPLAGPVARRGASIACRTDSFGYQP